MKRRALVLVSVLTLASCGSDVEEAAPPRVAVELAPPAIGEDLALYENVEDEIVQGFANLGDNTLVADGRLWEVRHNDRLIGTLQITTVLPEVDLTEEDQRASIAGQVIPGQLLRLRVEGVDVYATEAGDKAVYLWFGQDMYQVFQVKDARLEGEYEPLLADILRHQATVDAWRPLTA